MRRETTAKLARSLGVALGLGLLLAGPVFARAAARPLPEALPRVWSMPLQSPEAEDLEPLFVRGDVLILGSLEFGSFRAVDLSTHSVLWRRDGAGHSHPDPVGATDLLTTSDDSSPAVVRISSRSGKPRWRAELPAPVDGFGYFARAGEVGCFVFRKPTASSTALDRYSPESYGSALIDLRNGSRLRPVHPLPDLPLDLDLDVPRFLSVRPGLSESGPTGPGRGVTLTCLDAVSGKKAWTREVTPAQGQLGEPFVYWARWPLGLSVARLADASQRLSLSWLDLSTGAVLRRDVVPESDPGDLGYVIVTGGKPASTASAQQLLARTRWLYCAEGRLVLVDPGKPKSPERVWDWAAFLPRGVDLDGPFWWDAAQRIAWPFITIRYYRPKGGPAEGVLLINLQTGAVYRAAGWAGLVEAKRGLLYTTTESQVSAYRLPRKR